VCDKVHTPGQKPELKAGQTIARALLRADHARHEGRYIQLSGILN
jgi:hypothetical protein